MDRDAFDGLARFLATTPSRRAALGSLLAGAVLGASTAISVADPKRKGTSKERRRRRGRGRARPCYAGTGCVPGQGRDNAGCDFTNSTRFFEGDFHGSDFSGANFTGAQMAGAKLHGADLGKACLVGANLRDAELDGADLDGAVFCRTTMPDGSRNDSDCGRGTRCCPTPCEDEACVSDSCINTPGQICSVFGTPCCQYQSPAGWWSGQCTPLAVAPVLTFCQWTCDSDSDCTDFLGPGARCIFDPACFPYAGGKCCQFV